MKYCASCSSSSNTDGEPLYDITPRRSIYTISASSRICLRLCSTTTTILCVCRANRLTRSNIVPISSGERPADGSSSSNTRGWQANTPASATICLSPPERFSVTRFRSSTMRSNVPIALCIDCDRSFAGSDRVLTTRFSSTVKSSNNEPFWGSNAIPNSRTRQSTEAWTSTARSPTTIAPLTTSQRPMTARSTVDLPLPFAPIIAVILPLGALMLTSFSTTRLP